MLLLGAARDLLSHQLSFVPGDSPLTGILAVVVHAVELTCLAAARRPHEASYNHGDLQQSIKAVCQDSAVADGALALAGITSVLLQKQFMFAVHEGAERLRQQLQQMRQAKQSLLQAVRTGMVDACTYFWYWLACSSAKVSPHTTVLVVVLHHGFRMGPFRVHNE